MNRTLSIALLALALTALSFAACAGTSGRPIAFPVAADARGATTFRTSTGWDVTLDEARLGLRALRVHRGDDVVTSSLTSVLVPLARAHGGHGAAGEGLRAELLGPLEIDALAGGALELGTAEGSAGRASSVELELGGLDGGLDVVARVRGTATRDGVSLAFSGVLELAGGLRVSALPLEVTLDETGVLRLVTRADRWLDQAHFERLGEGGVIEPGAQVALAWSLGLRDPQAFGVEWEMQEGGVE